MKTVILGGPTLALDTAIKTRHYTIIDVETSRQISSVIVDRDKKTHTLLIHSADQTEENTAAVCRLMKSVSLCLDPTIPLVANDTHAVSLAYLLSGNVASNDPDIIAAWTSLDFTLEMSNTQRDGTTNRVRFTGANIVGIKKISTASTVSLTISQKRK